MESVKLTKSMNHSSGDTLSIMVGMLSAQAYSVTQKIHTMDDLTLGAIFYVVFIGMLGGAASFLGKALIELLFSYIKKKALSFFDSAREFFKLTKIDD